MTLTVGNFFCSCFKYRNANSYCKHRNTAAHAAGKYCRVRNKVSFCKRETSYSEAVFRYQMSLLHYSSCTNDEFCPFPTFNGTSTALYIPIFYNGVMRRRIEICSFCGLAVLCHYHQVSAWFHFVLKIHVVIENHFHWKFIVFIACCIRRAFVDFK